jgi:arabinogalactan oligomer/maltooligosaccharide transport system substrate-binding protein
MGTYWSAMGSAYGGIWDGDNVKQDLDAAAAAMEAAN